MEEHARKVKPPRMLSVPFNFGHTLGRPNDAEYQHRVIKAAFDLLSRTRGPVLEQFRSDLVPEVIVQGSETTNLISNCGMKAVDELLSFGPHYEQWLGTYDGRTSVGLSDVPWWHFAEIVEFLEGYIDGDQLDTCRRPKEYDIPQFIRYCVDDLKAFCFEAMIMQQPENTVEQLHRWFWSETAVGALIIRLAKRMNSDADKKVRAVAFGIAR